MHMGIAFHTKGEMPWVLFILTILHIGITSDAQSLTLLNDTVLPMKGSSFGMSCMLSVPFTSNGITLHKNDIHQGTCLGSSHACLPDLGYILKANQTGVFMTISSLDRDSHEGIWTCRYTWNQNTVNSNPVNLTVYTLPTGIRFTQEPSENVDLSMISVTFQCGAIGCSYPDPVIRWLYEDQDRATGIQTGILNSCISSEKIYTSTLFIQGNSTVSDNSDKTVIFSCRIDYPDPSIIISASATKSVRFSVRVTEAVLQHNNQNITETLTVTSAEPVTLTCMTGTSRPAPTIDWYIGSQKRGSGPSLTMTFNNMDHNETIYCQAYNIDPSRLVSSAKPRIFVQVRVTEAVLQQNNQNITETLTVISAEPVTLTCVTGTSRPAPTINWYIGSQKRGDGPSLTITFSNMDHNETIYCQVYNIDPSRLVSSAKPRLFVQAAPKILDVSPDYKGYVGQYIMIQFDLYSNMEENLTVTARHSNSSGLIHRGTIRPTLLDDLPVYSTDVPAPGFKATVVISITSKDDFGQYDIEVKNIIGSDSKSIKITEQNTPEKPINFHVTNIQEKQLSLMWLSGYHGGFTQMFVVEASLNNITWTNMSQVNAGNRDGWFPTIVGNLIPGSEYYLRLHAYNIHGRGDFADVQLATRTLRECVCASSLEVGASVGIGVGGAVLGLIAAIIAFTIRRLNGPKSSCFRSKGKTDDEMRTYSDAEMNPQTVKPIYEELNKGNAERNVYDKISPL